MEHISKRSVLWHVDFDAVWHEDCGRRVVSQSALCHGVVFGDELEQETAFLPWLSQTLTVHHQASFETPAYFQLVGELGEDPCTCMPTLQ